MKVDFRKLNCEVRFGEYEEHDFAKLVGNTVHANTADIAMDDLARTIYYSEGAVELSGEQAQAIAGIIGQSPTIVAWLKKAITDALTIKEEQQ